MLTAIALKMNVEVQSQLSCSSVQSDDSESRTGRKMKYAVISTKTNANDSSVAFNSCGSTFVDACTSRFRGFRCSVSATPQSLSLPVSQRTITTARRLFACGEPFYYLQ
jgi:hypothetical protein